MLSASSRDKLASCEVQFHEKHAMTVVLAAENYPGSVEKGRSISNVPDSSPDSWVNHAGTKVKMVNFCPMVEEYFLAQVWEMSPRCS